MIIYTIVVVSVDKKFNETFFVDLSNCICLVTILILSMTRSFEANVDTFAWIILSAIVITSAFNSLVRESDHSLWTVFLLVFVVANFSIDFTTAVIFLALISAWYFCSYAVLYKSMDSFLWSVDAAVGKNLSSAKAYALISIMTIVLLIVVVLIVQRHIVEKLVKREFISGSVLQSRSNLTKDLLKLLLPSFVLDQMKSFEVTGNNIDGDGVDEGEVAILFCDIADFDKVIKLKEDNIVKILDSIFRRFDELTKENGCQKIETVGKTYMACGGLRYVEQTLSAQMKESNPTARILNLAKQMMEEIKNYEELNLKIGIHRGKCMMGVIGYHKPQFSLIGDTINFTSRHCTTGDKGHIMVSQEAWQFLTESNVKARGFTYTVRQTHMKGKGDVDVYHVTPFQGLFRKRLESINNRYKSEGLEMSDDMMVIDKVLKNTRQELKSKIVKLRINKLLKNVMETAKDVLKQGLRKEDLHIDGGRDGNVSISKHSNNPDRMLKQGSSLSKRRRGSMRTKKHKMTKMINFHQQVVELPIDTESSDSEQEEGVEVVSSYSSMLS